MNEITELAKQWYFKLIPYPNGTWEIDFYGTADLDNYYEQPTTLFAADFFKISEVIKTHICK